MRAYAYNCTLHTQVCTVSYYTSNIWRPFFVYNDSNYDNIEFIIIIVWSVLSLLKFSGPSVITQIMYHFEYTYSTCFWPISVFISSVCFWSHHFIHAWEKHKVVLAGKSGLKPSLLTKIRLYYIMLWWYEQFSHKEIWKDFVLWDTIIPNAIISNKTVQMLLVGWLFNVSHSHLYARFV